MRVKTGQFNPRLLSFYINQVNETILGQTVSCLLGGKNYVTICFANDIAVMPYLKMRLQIFLGSLEELHDGTFLTLPRCHILVEVGDHGMSPLSILRHSQQSRQRHFSWDVLHQARSNLHSLPASRSPSFYFTKEHLFFQAIMH